MEPAGGRSPDDAAARNGEDRGGGSQPMSEVIRYAAAACQTDFANPLDRLSMRQNTDRMLAMIDAAVAGSAPFLPVRLVVFPEFAHAAPVFATVARAARQAGAADPERAHRPARTQGARARHLHPERLDDRGRPALARRGLQHHLPDRPRGAAVPLPQGESVDSRTRCTPARTTSRTIPTRSFPWPTRRSAGSAARSATTGCSPKRCGSWPRTAPRC